MTVLPLPREGKYKNPLFGSERNPGIKPITNRMGGRKFGYIRKMRRLYVALLSKR